MADDEIRAIEPPRTRTELTLLLMRWNALRTQGMQPAFSEEMAHLTALLQQLAAQQRAYKARLEGLPRPHLRESLKPHLRALKLLTRQIDLPEDLQAELCQAAGVPLSSDSPKEGKRLEQKVDQLIGSSQPVAETIIRNRILHRVTELENLAANLGTINLDSTSLQPPDAIPDGCDELKTRAIIELKQLRLLTNQKALRQHVIYHLAADSRDPAWSILRRNLNRRVKVPSFQELQLTENLEKQQRAEQEYADRAHRMKLVNAALARAGELHQEIHQVKQRHVHLCRSVQSFHAHVEKEEAKRAEKTAKQRLQALRSNDEEAYIKLLDQTKDTRITHLLKQTNQFLASLSQAVRVQQAETGAEQELTDEDLEKIDYYEVAHRIKEPVTKQASIMVGGTLKEYQIKGLQWMVSLVNNNLNGILADEMGLGKTIQTIALITYLIEVKRWSGPFLVIVPLSTITNWTVEFDKWAPSVRKIVYKGPPNARKALQGQVRGGDFQILLSTYEYIIKDRPLLSKIKWQHMIIDEGHRMKNAHSKLSLTLAQYYHSRFRLILTGTPLQNNLPELWALLNFVLPKIFNSAKTFDEWFNTPFANTGTQDKMELTEEELLLIIRRLHKVLRPFLLRRLKKDVEKDLPDKVEKVIKCKMSALQLVLYQQMVEHNIVYVGSSTDDNKLHTGFLGLNNKIMQLRKICNHPYVFHGVEDLVDPSHQLVDLLWRTAGKFELLDRILPKFFKSGHRVLIFFQMTQIMDIMEDYLRSRGMYYLRLDGATKAEERSNMLKLFNAQDSPYFCFLLSTRAGGLGLNLQSADTVIIYDTDWNPFQDLQAQDRAHRIGQTKEVRILRLITNNSVEEGILDRAMSKLEIDSKVIQAGKFDNKSTSEEQEAFLRSLLEAEEARREAKDDDEEMDDEELNDILARGENEVELFKEMDAERAATDPKQGRLYTYDELPQVYKEPITKYIDQKPEPRHRSRRRITYDDGLTEEEFLQLAEEAEEERNHTRRRAKKQRVDPLSVEERDALTSKCNDLIDQIMNSVADADPPRSRAGIFLELPSKKQYPDYYKVIKHPISLSEIQKSIDGGTYKSFADLKKDLYQMLKNARTYNQEGSLVYEDANVLQGMVDEAN